VLSVFAALGSALLVAVASVLQHRAGHSGSGLRFRHVLRHPLWIIGAAAGVAGFTLHVVALSGGALSVVQPLLVSGLLFALPLSRALEHRGIKPAEVVAAAAVVGGLAIFQLTARPSAGRSVADLSVLGWCLAATTVFVGVGIAFAVRSAKGRGAWLGLCAGVAYGLVAALMKSTVGAFTSRGTSVLEQWPLYAFVIVVLGAITVNQLAFNAGPLAQSLPLITIADPLVSVAIGSIAFDETVSHSPALVTGQVIGFLVMSVGVFTLSKHAIPVGPHLSPLEDAPLARA
jgi:drug/metabolite transporter (DMT)-like permease